MYVLDPLEKEQVRHTTSTRARRDFGDAQCDLARRLTCLQDEADRLIDQHLILHYIFGERLFFPNIPNLRRVLDCGYGRASWALAVAEMYEEVQVR